MNTEKIVILAAELAEYNMCKEFFPDCQVIYMGVGASNVIKTCCQLPEGTKVVNIGYVGSNNLPIGTVVKVSETYRWIDNKYVFTDYANPLRIAKDGFPCYTNNSFITECDRTDTVLFDMELNYIAAFTPHIRLLASIKIVSDNLSVEEFDNNALRESGLLSCSEVWLKVREIFDNI